MKTLNFPIQIVVVVSALIWLAGQSCQHAEDKITVRANQFNGFNKCVAEIMVEFFRNYLFFFLRFVREGNI